MISINLTPNFSLEEVDYARRVLAGEEGGVEIEMVEKKITEYLGGFVAVVDSGRGAMWMLMKALGLWPSDEVIIQGFTCSVVPMAIMAVGARPIYADIDESYNLAPENISKLITKKTKAVVVQHTFGTPAKIDEIQAICDKNGVILIEDLAHGLGGSYKGRKLGSWGQIAALSFGRDKVISGVWGGVALAADHKIGEGFKLNLRSRDLNWAKRQMRYVVAMDWIKKNYDSGLGKLAHLGLRKLKLVDDAITLGEKRGEMGEVFGGLPKPLLGLINLQWEKMEKMIARRREIAKYYAEALGMKFNEEATYLRFTVESLMADELRIKAAGENIFLGDWYSQVVAPRSVDPVKFGYEKGSCPVAEAKAKVAINLPTNPNLTDEEAEKVIKWWQKNGN